MQHRNDIDGLRAVAIALTLAFHLFPSEFPGGFVGVDVFFVISGYLITGILGESLDHGTFSIASFYARRVIRLLPALITVLFAVLGVAWFLLLSDEFLDLGKQVVAAGLFSSNILLIFETNYFNPDAQTKPLLHLWSLGVEEQFYIAYPLLLFFLSRLRIQPLVPLLLLAGASLWLALATAPLHQVQAFYSPATRAWELLLGATLQLLHRGSAKTVCPSRMSAGQTALFFFGMASIGYGAWTIKSGQPYPTWQALLPTVGAAAIIAVRQPGAAQNILLSNRAMGYLGRISYPLYLWHWPVISFATILSAGEPVLSIRTTILVLSLVLAALTYHFVEALIRRSQNRGTWVTMLLVALAFVTAAGGAAWMTGGFPHRTAATVLPPGTFSYPYKESCQEITKARYGDDWCFPHTPSDPAEVLLLGDSFSAPYGAMLAELSKFYTFSFKQYGRGQCAPLFDYGPKACRELLSAVLAQANLSRVKTVVLAADWRQYLDGKAYFLMPDAAPESAESFRKALRDTVEYWIGAGKRVVLLYGPPQGANPLECVSRAFSLKPEKDCRITRAEAQRNEKDGQKKLAQALEGMPEVVFFDPFPYLCDQEHCNVKHGRDFLYVDRFVQEKDTSVVWNHLSAQGGAVLAQRSRAELSRALALQ